jgi:hypothetical protein
MGTSTKHKKKDLKSKQAKKTQAGDNDYCRYTFYIFLVENFISESLILQLQVLKSDEN